jgi:hypothetical protein
VELIGINTDHQDLNKIRADLKLRIGKKTTQGLGAGMRPETGEISAKHPTLCIPYRCLVPRKVDGLLVACRAFSSEDSINQQFNIIPHCICYGQAAGTAAAMAAKAGIQPRNVNYKRIAK